MKIIIAADSTCDLSPELIKENDIKIMPLYVNLGEKSLRDGIDIVPDDIFKYVDLSNWADAKINDKPIPDNLLKYENDVSIILDELNQFLTDLNEDKLHYYNEENNLPEEFKTILKRRIFE